jgi:hypothetical protein
MKKVIELLERALQEIRYTAHKFSVGSIIEGKLDIAIENLKYAIVLLQKPRWETPEQWEKRMGEAWPDDWAVYALYEDNGGRRQWFWGGCEKERDKTGRRNKNPLAIVCATEAGKPPDGWEPEKKNEQ